MLIASYAPTRKAKGGIPPFAVETILVIHFLQKWFNLSDLAMKEWVYDTELFRDFAGLDMGKDHLSDEITILRFRHILEAHHLNVQMVATVNATLAANGWLLKQETMVDAMLIAAPCSTKNRTGNRDLEMRKTKKSDQWNSACRHTPEWMQTLAWCAAWQLPQPTHTMSNWPMRCCTGKKQVSLPTRATGLLRSAKKSRLSNLM